jgi:hypothetical protein
MNRQELIDMIDSAMWNARGYGHSDNGLQDYDTSEYIDTHPEAEIYADAILAAFAKDEG